MIRWDGVAWGLTAALGIGALGLMVMGRTHDNRVAWWAGMLGIVAAVSALVALDLHGQGRRQP